jgi:hypothetical protein
MINQSLRYSFFESTRNHGFSRFLIEVNKGYAFFGSNFGILGIPKVSFQRPGTEKLGLTYSATCQIYWVIWDLPVLFPDRDILCFAEEILY